MILFGNMFCFFFLHLLMRFETRKVGEWGDDHLVCRAPASLLEYIQPCFSPKIVAKSCFIPNHDSWFLTTYVSDHFLISSNWTFTWLIPNNDYMIHVVMRLDVSIHDLMNKNITVFLYSERYFDSLKHP